MKIEVTQEDIRNGKCKSFWGCPIALALARAGFKDVIVSAAYACSKDKTLDFPVEALHFINRFDRGETVKPFTFEINEN